MQAISHHNKGIIDEAFWNTVGFTGIRDVWAHTIPKGMKYITIISLTLAAITEIFGVPVQLFVGLILCTVLELISGVVVSLWYRNEKWSSKKFFRFFFKTAILIFLLLSINQMKAGFLQITEANHNFYVDVFIRFSLDSLFLFFLLAMAWYVILSVVENMAQTKMRFFVTLAKYLNVKINKLEEFAAEK